MKDSKDMEKQNISFDFKSKWSADSCFNLLIKELEEHHTEGRVRLNSVQQAIRSVDFIVFGPFMRKSSHIKLMFDEDYESKNLSGFNATITQKGRFRFKNKHRCFAFFYELKQCYIKETWDGHPVFKKYFPKWDSD